MCFWPVQCHRQTFSALCQGGYRSSPPPPSTKWRLARSSDASLPPNASTPPSSAESFAGNTKQKKTSVEPICQPQLLLLLFFCVFTQWRSSSKDDGRCFSLSAESRALPSIYNTHEREREPHPCLIFCRGDDTLKILLFVSSLIGIFDSPSHMLLQSHHHHFRRKKNFLFPPNMELIFKEWVWHKSFGNQSAGTSFGGR